MAEDLLDTIGQLFGPIRGGLAYAVILVGAMLAATTGVVAASVISMGLISLPIMLRYGYDRRVASGVIAASGTLAQIIPPSLVLIVLADQLGRSVGDLYKGAFIPGFTLTGLYIALRAGREHRPARAGRRRCRSEARTIREDDGTPGPALARRRRSCSRSARRSSSPRPGRRATADRRADRRLDVRRRRHRVRCSRSSTASLKLQPAVAHGRARDLRPDPAAGADLPRPRHDLPRRRDADRRRRDGRRRRAGDGAGAPPPRPAACCARRWTRR